MYTLYIVTIEVMLRTVQSGFIDHFSYNLQNRASFMLPLEGKTLQKYNFFLYDWNEIFSKVEMKCFQGLQMIFILSISGVCWHIWLCCVCVVFPRDCDNYWDNVGAAVMSKMRADIIIFPLHPQRCGTVVDCCCHTTVFLNIILQIIFGRLELLQV